MNEESNRESLYREELSAAESISNERTVKFPQELYPENIMDRFDWLVHYSVGDTGA